MGTILLDTEKSRRLQREVREGSRCGNAGAKTWKKHGNCRNRVRLITEQQLCSQSEHCTPDQSLLLQNQLTWASVVVWSRLVENKVSETKYKRGRKKREKKCESEQRERDSQAGRLHADRQAHTQTDGTNQWIDV